MVPIGRILIFVSILLFSNGCQNAFDANNTWDPYFTPPETQFSDSEQNEITSEIAKPF